MRDPKLQTFFNATFDMLEDIEIPAEGRDLIRQVRSNLSRVVEASPGTDDATNPVREKWLESALAIARGRSTRVDAFCDAFIALEPDLAWRRRGNGNPDEEVSTGHANAVMAGPNAYEDRDDVWVGVTLMSPGAEYPLHRHPPRELYLALTEGEWTRDGGPWFSPGILATVFNPPGVVHSMRAAGTPFLSLWLLAA